MCKMSKTVYVPSCFTNECKQWLEQLKKDLEEHGFQTRCEQDFPVCGIYYNHYKEQSLKCSYTILHKCLQLWKKIKNRVSLEILSQSHQRQRCFCLRFCTKQRYRPMSEWDLSRIEFEAYFDNFQILDVREFNDLSRFVGSLSSRSDTDGHQSIQCNGSSNTLRRNDRYYTQTVSESTILKKIQALRDQMALNYGNHQDMQVVPENNGCHLQYIKKEDCLKESENLINLNTIDDLQGMKNKLNKLMKNADAASVNISFITHQVLPFLLDNTFTPAVVTLATVDNEEIQRQAVNTLELLAFTGKLSAQYIDLSTLERCMSYLLGSVTEDKKTKSAQHLRIRKFSIFLMLEEEMVFRCKDEQDLSIAEDFNKRFIFSLLKKQTIKEEKPYFKIIKELMRQPFQCLSDFISDFHLPKSNFKPVSKELLKKPKLFQFFFIYQVLKKFFLDPDNHVIDFLKAYLKQKKLTSMCTCVHLIQWGISQFLYLQSKKGTLNLSLFCPGLKDILLLCRKKDLKCFEQVEDMLRNLMCCPVFDIRQSTIQLLKSIKGYSEKLASSLTFIVQQILYPMFEIDKQEITRLSRLRITSDWLKARGYFKVYQAKLFLYIPGEKEHIDENKTSFTTFDDVLIWHEIEMLQKLSHPDIITLFAFNKHSVPQFYLLEDFEDKCENMQEFLVNRHRNSVLCKPSSLFQMTCQAVDAVEFCHSKKIILRNINTRSFKVDNRENIKLKNFKQALQLQQPKDEISVDTQDNKKILIRWCAPESVRRSKFSLKTDVWQVGHLIIEVNTHGRIPYPELKLNDPEIDIEIIKLSARSQKQLNIKKELFKIVYLCLSTDKNKRPDLSVICSKLREIHTKNTLDGDIILNEAYPKCHLSYEKLTEKLERGIASIDHKLFKQNNASKVSYPGNLILHKEKNKCIFQQKLDRRFSLECLNQIRGGDLDCVLPFLRIKSNETLEIHIVDIQISSDLHSSIAELIRKKTKIRDEIPLKKVFRCMAEILDKLHSAGFLIGIVNGSHFFFENSDEGNIWVHLASIANVSLKTDKTIHKKIISSLEGKIRLPPELKQSGLFTTESDIFSFANAIFNLFLKKPMPETVAPVPTDIENQEAAHITEEFICQMCDMKHDHYQCLHLCLDDDPSRRPSVADIIKIFSTEEEIALNEALVQEQACSEIIAGDTNGAFGAVVNPSVINRSVINPSNSSQTHYELEFMEHHPRFHDLAHSSVFRRRKAANNLHNARSLVTLEHPRSNMHQHFIGQSNRLRHTFLPHPHQNEVLSVQGGHSDSELDE